MSQKEMSKEDMADARVPKPLFWDYDQVAAWVEGLGFPFYRDCFLTNMINGRRLILLEASALPSLGITDFQHIKVITKGIRELLQIELPGWKRSIALPPRDALAMYLERKSMTGKEINSMSFEKFSEDYCELKFEPPLDNTLQILST